MKIWERYPLRLISIRKDNMTTQTLIRPKQYARSTNKVNYKEDVELKVTDYDKNGLKYSIRMDRDGHLYAIVIGWKYMKHTKEKGVFIPRFIDVDL